MGSYAALTIDGFQIESWKNEYLTPDVMGLFKPSDRIVSLDGTTIAPSEPIEEGREDGHQEVVFQYAAPVRLVRDRLEVQAITLAKARDSFDRVVKEKLDEIRGWASQDGDLVFADEIEVLSTLTLDGWLAAFGEIRSRGLGPRFRGDEDLNQHPPLLRYMLGTLGGDTNAFGFPYSDLRHLLRVILEVFEPDAPVVLDLSDLCQGGWVSLGDDLCEWAVRSLWDEFPVAQRIIVLTEGVSDSRALRNALECVFPHLADYYSFLDFEAFGVAGGAGNLANLVKAFSAAGIVNRIVALFDNDTAGRTAAGGLARLNLPDNIRVITCPSVEFCSKYPTVGPTGSKVMDVNGLASSIELYMGRDALSDQNGDLRPVQWRAYDDRAQSYQGEITGKALIQDAFMQKVVESKRQGRPIGDWEEMRHLLQALFRAFH